MGRCYLSLACLLGAIAVPAVLAPVHRPAMLPQQPPEIRILSARATAEGEPLILTEIYNPSRLPLRLFLPPVGWNWCGTEQEYGPKTLYLLSVERAGRRALTLEAWRQPTPKDEWPRVFVVPAFQSRRLEVQGPNDSFPPGEYVVDFRCLHREHGEEMIAPPPERRGYWQGLVKAPSLTVHVPEKRTNE